jgi:hypothetical protein
VAGLAVAADPSLVGIGPAATPSHSPTQSTRPTPDATKAIPAVFEDSLDGYTVKLPGDWHRAASLWGETMRFAPDGGQRSLTVSVGTSVLDGGSVAACAGQTTRRRTCADLTVGYSIPYQASHSFELLSGRLDAFLGGCAGDCQIERTATTLGPDPAVRLELTQDERRLTFLAAMHGYRPLILSWDEPAASADPDLIEAARASFGWKGEDPKATPTVLADPFGPRLFRNEPAGYQVMLPGRWVDGQSPDETVILDGITIMAGDADGRFMWCRPNLKACPDEPITTLEGLEAAIVSGPIGISFTEHHRDTTLGGEPARIESVTTSAGQLLGPPAWYSVYAMHHGRPYAIVGDYWRLHRGDVDQSWIDSIVASFEFLD